MHQLVDFTDLFFRNVVDIGDGKAVLASIMLASWGRWPSLLVRIAPLDPFRKTLSRAFFIINTVTCWTKNSIVSKTYFEFALLFRVLLPWICMEKDKTR